MKAETAFDVYNALPEEEKKRYIDMINADRSKKVVPFIPSRLNMREKIIKVHGLTMRKDWHTRGVENK